MEIPADFGYLDSLPVPMSGHRAEERRLARSSRLRPAAKKRDGDLCRCCNLPGAKEMHHIQPLCFGGEDVLENVVMLCALCHKYAPNDGGKFLAYQKRGGMLPERAVQVSYRVIDLLTSRGDFRNANKQEQYLIKLKRLIRSHDLEGLRQLSNLFRPSDFFGYFPYPHVEWFGDHWMADGCVVSLTGAKEMLMESIRRQIGVIRWASYLYPELPSLPVTPRSMKALDSIDFLLQWFKCWGDPIDKVLSMRRAGSIPENIVRMFFNVQYAIDTMIDISSCDPGFVDTPLPPLLDHYCKHGCIESALKAGEPELVPSRVTSPSPSP